jgi:pimeloyl-ACP methyl ester carboxylesterase
MQTLPAPTAALELAGPWEHRMVSANGARFHAVEAGSGPLVLLLHGFPQCWLAWRSQLVALADAGYRAVALDLRGYGLSDKPPRGYDPVTLSADVAGVVRSLGVADAVVVGHDWGGLLAWTTAVGHPKVVRRLCVVSAPHPLRVRASLPRNALRTDVSAHVLGLPAPAPARARLLRDGAAGIGAYLQRWGVAGLAGAGGRRRLPGRRERARCLCTPRWSTTAGRCARSRARTACATPGR